MVDEEEKSSSSERLQRLEALQEPLLLPEQEDNVAPSSPAVAPTHGTQHNITCSTTGDAAATISGSIIATATTDPSSPQRDATNDDDGNNGNASLSSPPPLPSQFHDAQQQQQRQGKHYNIPLTLWYQFLRCLPEAIWLTSVLSIYVYLLRPDQPEMVGYLSALEGVSQFFAACIAGVLADWYRRDVLLKGSSVIGLAASILLVVAALGSLSSSSSSSSSNNDETNESNKDKYFWCIPVALILNGAFDGIGLTACLALFADSIDDGKRSHYFTQRTLCTTIGYFVGPVFGLVMFVVLGDHWTIASCATVIIVAQALLLPAFALLWFFRDVEQHQPADGNNHQNIVPSATSQDGRDAENDREEVAAPLLANDDDDALQSPEEDEEEPHVGHVSTGLPRRCCMRCSKSRWIAMGSAASDMIGALANGVSFRYFAVFFVKDLHFGPVLVQVLDALSCLLGAGTLVAAQRSSLRWKSRCLTSVVFKGAGIVSLLAMVACYLFWFHHPGTLAATTTSTNSTAAAVEGHGSSFFTPTHDISIVIGMFYVLQNALLNSTGALTRSLIMDHVPSHERARWSALESINIFGWCGSAAIGGWVVKLFGGALLPVFYVTAALHVVGALPLVALIGWDQHEQNQEAQEEGNNIASPDDDNARAHT